MHVETSPGKWLWYELDVANIFRLSQIYSQMLRIDPEGKWSFSLCFWNKFEPQLEFISTLARVWTKECGNEKVLEWTNFRCIYERKKIREKLTLLGTRLNTFFRGDFASYEARINSYAIVECKKKRSMELLWKSTFGICMNIPLQHLSEKRTLQVLYIFASEANRTKRAANELFYGFISASLASIVTMTIISQSAELPRQFIGSFEL